MQSIIIMLQHLKSESKMLTFHRNPVLEMSLNTGLTLWVQTSECIWKRAVIWMTLYHNMAIHEFVSQYIVHSNLFTFFCTVFIHQHPKTLYTRHKNGTTIMCCNDLPTQCRCPRTPLLGARSLPYLAQGLRQLVSSYFSPSRLSTWSPLQ